MKKIISIFILCFFVCLNLCSQNKGVTIVFKDGTKMDGVGRLTSNGEIRIKPDGQKKTKKIEFSDTKEVLIGGQEFIQFSVFDKKDVVVTKLIVGAVSLYKKTTDKVIINAGYNPTYGGHKSKHKYYLKKKADVKLTYIGTSNQLNTEEFWKKVSAFLDACPSLIKKVKNEEIGNHHLENMIEHYNLDCSG